MSTMGIILYGKVFRMYGKPFRTYTKVFRLYGKLFHRVFSVELRTLIT